MLILIDINNAGDREFLRKHAWTASHHAAQSVSCYDGEFIDLGKYTKHADLNGYYLGFNTKELYTNEAGRIYRPFYGREMIAFDLRF